MAVEATLIGNPDQRQVFSDSLEAVKSLSQYKIIDWNGKIINDPVDESIVEHFAALIRKSMRDNNGEPNLVDVIAWSNGWNSLEPAHQMDVSYGDISYHIWRKK